MKIKGKTVFHIILTILTVLLCIILLGTIGISLYLTLGIDSDIDDLMLFTKENRTPSRLFAVSADGTLEEYGENQISLGMNNEYVSIDRIPKDLINAFIAIEDKRFYSHIGFDFITTTKAVIKYLLPGGSAPGGSTITQQLVKNLTGNDEISIERKLTEIMKAVKLEKVMNKDEILEVYLNTIYLSQGTYGVSAAARLYFDKSVEELTLIECAAIAAITQAPTKWDPIQNPENNRTRRNVILSEMYQNGMISEEIYLENREAELITTPSYNKVVGVTSSWYTDAVISEALTLLESSLSVSRKVAEHHLYQGGYRIIIAVDPEIQSYVESIYKDESLFSDNGAQSSFVIVDPENGNVLALAGGVGIKNANRVLNRATQTIRSPGSALKPVSVYLPALENGVLHYGSTIDDVPLYFGDQFSENGWPKNANGVYRGLVSLEKAVASSLNTASVICLERLGIDNAFHHLKDNQIFTTLTDSDNSLSSLALGGMTKGVTLLELTAAYTPIAYYGIYTKPRIVIGIYDKGGNLIVDNPPSQSTVCRESTAQTLTKLLEGVIKREDGTAYHALPLVSNISSVAGKTGTTSNQYDRWFIGYTPSLIGGIWVGYDEQKSLSDVSSKKHLTVWDQIMSMAEKRKNQQKDFEYSLLCEARYCIYSGKIATEACYSDPRGGAVATGFFTKETLPSHSCDTHMLISYCNEGHGIATDHCPDQATTSVGLILVNRSFPVNVTVRDSQYTCMDLPKGYTPAINDTDPYYKYYAPKGSYIGHSNTLRPYNRACSLHSLDTENQENSPDI